MDGRTSRRQKKISKRQEARIAEDLGGRTQPASGALPGAKGDVRKMGAVRAEAKYTGRDSFVLKKAELDKIIREAGLERAVLQVCFVERNGRPILELAVVPWQPEGPSLSLLRANLQTFGKSMTLVRDTVAVKLLKEDFYVVFTEWEPGTEDLPKARHNWFRIFEWKSYLAYAEKLDA